MRTRVDSHKRGVDSRKSEKPGMVNQTKTAPAGAAGSPELSPKLTKRFIGICNDLSSEYRIQSIANNKPAVGRGADIERPIIIMKGVVA